MNVRVRPTMRCTFDAEDNVLRIVLKEAVEFGDGPPETRAQELVVYALKVCSILVRNLIEILILAYVFPQQRGRVPRNDFKEFAEALVENSLLKSAISPNDLPAAVDS